MHLRPSPVWAWRCRHDVPVCRIRPLVELHGLVWWSHTAVRSLQKGGSTAGIQEGFESAWLSTFRLVIFADVDRWRIICALGWGELLVV